MEIHTKTAAELLKLCEESNILIPETVKICQNVDIKRKFLMLMIQGKSDDEGILKQCVQDNKINEDKILEEMLANKRKLWDEFMKSNAFI